MKIDLAYETLSILTAGRKALSPAVIYTKYHRGLELFKIYSLYEGGQGFIICASVKNLPPVIGYSLNNSFFITGGPNNKDTERLLESITKTAIDNQSRHVTYDKDFAKRHLFELKNPVTPQSTDIYPLLKTHWTQESPYDNKTPDITGCVATAAAQIMKYYAWPTKGTGVIPAYTVRNTTMPAINIENFIYQWDKMKNAGYGTQEEDDAVADLMLHIASAVKMDYRGGASAAYVEDVRLALTEHYSYDSDLTYGSLDPRRLESTFSAYEVVSIVKYEIENKRPVQFGGNLHSLVCDGMDRNQFFHFNFGWGGPSDGYYNVFSSEYCKEIIAGVKPIEHLPLTMTDVNSERELRLGELFTTTVLLENTTGEDFNGQIILALADTYGAIICPLGEGQLVHIPAGTEIPITLSTRLPNILTCNPRRLYLLANSSSLKYGLKKIPNIRNDENFIPVNIARHETNDKVRLNTSLEAALSFYRDETTLVPVTLRNDGEPFLGSIVLCFVDKMDNVIHEITRMNDIPLLTGEIKKLVFLASVPTEIQTGNTYKMMVFYSSDDTLPLNAFAPLKGDGADVTNTAMVTIKSKLLPYMDALCLVSAPNYPVEISARYKTPIEFDLYCEHGIQGISILFLVLINENGVMFHIGDFMDVEPYEKGETKHHIITPKIHRDFDYGKYRIGITAVVASDDSEELLIPSVAGVDNPKIITVSSMSEAPFLRITQSLPTVLQLSPKEPFTLNTQLYLLPRENDDYAYAGNVIAYIALAGQSRIKVGEVINAFALSTAPRPLSIDCVLPEVLSEETYTLYLEASDLSYPELFFRISGETQEINDSVSIIVK